MRKLLILALATAVSTSTVAAHPEPEPAPEADREARVVREVHVLSGAAAPHLVQVQRGFFGISTLNTTSELLDHFGVDSDGGVMIASVSEDGPANRAGLEVGDVLVEVDGEKIESRFDASIVIGRLEPGSEVYAKVYRNGRPLTLEVTVGERERGQLPLNWIAMPHEGVAGAPAPAYQYRFKIGPDEEDVVVLNTDGMPEALERLREQVGSPEYRARFESFRERNADLEVRLQEMEKRLEEMGARLAEALAQIQKRMSED